MIRVFLIATLSILTPLTALAQETAPAQEEIKRDERFMSIHDHVKEITNGLDELSQKHFYALYGSYNLIQVVEDVRDQVDNAIDKCSDANPDMKDALKTRYKEWNEAIKPVMKDADANVDNMVKAQDYVPSSKIKKLFKILDEQRKKRNELVEKFPVTSPEACEYLRTKMDETQENLTSLLESTLVSHPQALIRDIDEKKEQQEAEQKAEEEAAEAERLKAEEEAAAKEKAEKEKAERELAEKEAAEAKTKAEEAENEAKEENEE